MLLNMDDKKWLIRGESVLIHTCLHSKSSDENSGWNLILDQTKWKRNKKVVLKNIFYTQKAWSDQFQWLENLSKKQNSQVIYLKAG